MATSNSPVLTVPAHVQRAARETTEDTAGTIGNSVSMLENVIETEPHLANSAQNSSPPPTNQGSYTVPPS